MIGPGTSRYQFPFFFLPRLHLRRVKVINPVKPFFFRQITNTYSPFPHPPLIHFVCPFLVPQYTQTVLHKLCLDLLLGLAPREMETMLMQNCLLCLGGQETRKQSVLREMWKWGIIASYQKLLSGLKHVAPIDFFCRKRVSIQSDKCQIWKMNTKK